MFLKIFCITNGYILYIIDSTNLKLILFTSICYTLYYGITTNGIMGITTLVWKKSNIRALLVEHEDNLIMNWINLLNLNIFV